jgi:hypothetical protein
MGRFSTRVIVALLTFIIGVSLVGAWLVGRYGHPEKLEPAAAVEPPIPADTFITMERTGCYGTCPSYTLAVSAGGSVVFNSPSYWVEADGTRLVKRSGVVKGRVSREQVRELIAEFEKANFFSLQDYYRDARDGCPEVATDMPRAFTSIQISGRKKSVEHYHGCLYAGRDLISYPKELTSLEDRIDEIVNTKQWMR